MFQEKLWLIYVFYNLFRDVTLYRYHRLVAFILGLKFSFRNVKQTNIELLLPIHANEFKFYTIKLFELQIQKAWETKQKKHDSIFTSWIKKKIASLLANVYNKLYFSGQNTFFKTIHFLVFTKSKQLIFKLSFNSIRNAKVKVNFFNLNLKFRVTFNLLDHELSFRKLNVEARLKSSVFDYVLQVPSEEIENFKKEFHSQLLSQFKNLNCKLLIKSASVEINGIKELKEFNFNIPVFTVYSKFVNANVNNINVAYRKELKDKTVIKFDLNNISIAETIETLPLLVLQNVSSDVENYGKFILILKLNCAKAGISLARLGSMVQNAQSFCLNIDAKKIIESLNRKGLNYDKAHSLVLKLANVQLDEFNFDNFLALRSLSVKFSESTTLIRLISFGLAVPGLKFELQDVAILKCTGNAELPDVDQQVELIEKLNEFCQKNNVLDVATCTRGYSHKSFKFRVNANELLSNLTGILSSVSYLTHVFLNENQIQTLIKIVKSVQPLTKELLGTEILITKKCDILLPGGMANITIKDVETVFLNSCLLLFLPLFSLEIDNRNQTINKNYTFKYNISNLTVNSLHFIYLFKIHGESMGLPTHILWVKLNSVLMFPIINSIIKITLSEATSKLDYGTLKTLISNPASSDHLNEILINKILETSALKIQTFYSEYSLTFTLVSTNLIELDDPRNLIHLIEDYHVPKFRRLIADASALSKKLKLVEKADKNQDALQVRFNIAKDDSVIVSTRKDFKVFNIMVVSNLLLNVNTQLSTVSFGSDMKIVLDKLVLSFEEIFLFYSVQNKESVVNINLIEISKFHAEYSKLPEGESSKFFRHFVKLRNCTPYNVLLPHETGWLILKESVVETVNIYEKRLFFKNKKNKKIELLKLINLSGKIEHVDVSKKIKIDIKCVNTPSSEVEIVFTVMSDIKTLFTNQYKPRTRVVLISLDIIENVSIKGRFLTKSVCELIVKHNSFDETKTELTNEKNLFLIPMVNLEALSFNHLTINIVDVSNQVIPIEPLFVSARIMNSSLFFQTSDYVIVKSGTSLPKNFVFIWNKETIVEDNYVTFEELRNFSLFDKESKLTYRCFDSLALSLGMKLYRLHLTLNSNDKDMIGRKTMNLLHNVSIRCDLDCETQIPTFHIEKIIAGKCQLDYLDRGCNETVDNKLCLVNKTKVSFFVSINRTTIVTLTNYIHIDAALFEMKFFQLLDENGHVLYSAQSNEFPSGYFHTDNKQYCLRFSAKKSLQVIISELFFEQPSELLNVNSFQRLGSTGTDAVDETVYLNKLKKSISVSEKTFVFSISIENIKLDNLDIIQQVQLRCKFFDVLFKALTGVKPNKNLNDTEFVDKKLVNSKEQSGAYVLYRIAKCSFFEIQLDCVFPTDEDIAIANFNCNAFVDTSVGNFLLFKLYNIVLTPPKSIKIQLIQCVKTLYKFKDAFKKELDKDIIVLIQNCEIYFSEANFELHLNHNSLFVIQLKMKDFTLRSECEIDEFINVLGKHLTSNFLTLNLFRRSVTKFIADLLNKLIQQ